MRKWKWIVKPASIRPIMMLLAKSCILRVQISLVNPKSNFKMKSAVAHALENVPSCCRAFESNRDNCSLSLEYLASIRAIIDLDCEALNLKNMIRCDYLFVGKKCMNTLIAPIELNGGKLKSVSGVVKQLKSGSKLATGLLPEETMFQFTPVLVHKRPINKFDLRKIRGVKIQFRKQKQMIPILRCGEPLSKAFEF